MSAKRKGGLYFRFWDIASARAVTPFVLADAPAPGPDGAHLTSAEPASMRSTSEVEITVLS